jgi:diaminohydroxyphosphoribosylaminopyrimidine deaminase/5-amino-6-(5-phosphoribosylamino)uracil reductase
VNGRGLAALKRAGLAVTSGVRAEEASALNETFLLAARLHRPFVALKAAMTLDGRIATAAGESKWITDARQRRRARALRRLYDGVAVGVGTVLADDPRLWPEPRTRRAFHRIVFDSRLRTPAGSTLVGTAGTSPVWILTTTEARGAAALEKRGVRVLAGPSRDGHVDLDWALAALRAEGLWSLMVEGGSGLLGTLLARRLFDQVVLFRAPLLLGGRGSLPAFGGPDPARLADAARLTMRRPLAASGRAASPPPAAASAEGAYEVWYPARGRYRR